METIDFLKRVAPRTDKIVVTQYDNTKEIFWNRATYSYEDLQQAAADIQKWDKNPAATIYFSIGSFANHEVVDDEGKRKIKRTQSMATTFRVLCFDLDCGADKPYATQREGLVKLAEVTKALGLPKPLIVLSGNGAHVYWVLNQDIDKARWERTSIALRVALAKNDLVIDTSKIHDPSMVLRPVGSHHKKAEPWKLVSVAMDNGEEYEPELFEQLLADYVQEAKPQSKPKKRNAMLDAVLNEGNDINLENVVQHCTQIAALVVTGGVTDANGSPVEEPLWRASLGFAKFTQDPEASIIAMAGKHPQFDLKDSLDKLDGWKGTGPTTCAMFEQLCPGACDGCPFKGKIKSPAQLSYETTVTVVNPQSEEAPTKQEPVAQEVKMPEGYVLRYGSIYRIEETESDSGVSKDFKFVSQYPMFIKAVFYDPEAKRSSFTLVVCKPISGWEENDYPMAVLAAAGKDFSAFLIDNQLFGFKTAGQQEKLRGYLMDYLQMVQSQVGTGYDYQTFGWQNDGSFVCGDVVINAPNNATERRIVGNAKSYLERVGSAGKRDGFVEAMGLLNSPGTNVIRSCVLSATTGVIAKYMGNGSSIVSVYSTETTTGKTLSLFAINSLYGHPRSLIQSRQDSTNAIYGMRGTLNNLPMTIDEVTMADDIQVANMAYSFSEGQEKTVMNQKREIRDGAKWNGPTFMTTNTSLFTKYANVMQQSEPMRVRTFEVQQNDRVFVSLKDDEGRIADRFGELLLNNYGFAMPELVQAVIALGGPEEVARKGAADFAKNFGFEFEPQERFYESMIKSAWTMGKIGKGLGLFPFDVKATVEFMLETVTRLRRATVDAKVDAIDVIGQFMQEFNDQIIEVTQEYGRKDSKPQVVQPAPMKAVMRAHYMYDNTNPIMPGSTLAINKTAFRTFLKRFNDAEDRVLRELTSLGALVSENERVTMFKNCRGRNPGQAWCIMINLNHPRFTSALAGGEYKKQSSLALAVLDGIQEQSNG